MTPDQQEPSHDDKVAVVSTPIDAFKTQQESLKDNSAADDTDKPPRSAIVMSLPSSKKPQPLKWAAAFFVIMFAGVGAYLVFSSHAATTAATKTWQTAADWNTGTLQDLTVGTSGVTLASATTQTTGTDIALHRSTVASSLENPSYPAGNVTDGSATTRWASALHNGTGKDPEWIYVDLGTSKQFSEVKLQWETAYGKAYQIQTSNDANSWNTVYRTTSGDGGTDDITGLNATGRYVRMYGTQRGTQWGYSLYSLQVFGAGNTGTSSSASAPITLNNSGGSITDSAGSKWTVSGGIVYKDGNKAGFTASVTEIAYVNNTIWQENSSNLWWSWSGTSWTGGSGIPTSPLGETNTTSGISTALSGTITLTFNANATANWTSVVPTENTPAGTTITWQYATSSNGTSWSPYSGAVSGLATSPYIRLRGTFSTNSAAVTPTLTKLVLNYTVTSSAAPPTASISANPQSISSGSTTTLTWSSANATSCTAGGGWSGTKQTSGTFTTGALTQTQTYTVTCTGNGGSSSPATTTVTVAAPTTGGGATSAGCSSNGVVAPCVGGSGASGWGNPAFDDEFNATSLNTTTWNTENGWNKNGVTVSTNNETVSGGNLVLTLASSSSGAEISANHYGLPVGGFAEARVEFPGNGTTVYNWPAWWISGSNWPKDGEADIFEGLGNAATTNYHYNNNGNQQLGPFNISGTWAGAFHTFGIYRGQGTNTIYWDGQAVKTYNTQDSGAAETLILTNGCYNGQCNTGAQMKVDYVRAWQK